MEVHNGDHDLLLDYGTFGLQAVNDVRVDDTARGKKS